MSKSRRLLSQIDRPKLEKLALSLLTDVLIDHGDEITEDNLYRLLQAHVGRGEHGQEDGFNVNRESQR